MSMYMRVNMHAYFSCILLTHLQSCAEHCTFILLTRSAATTIDRFKIVKGNRKRTWEQTSWNTKIPPQSREETPLPPTPITCCRLLFPWKPISRSQRSTTVNRATFTLLLSLSPAFSLPLSLARERGVEGDLFNWGEAVLAPLAAARPPRFVTSPALFPYLGWVFHAFFLSFFVFFFALFDLFALFCLPFCFSFFFRFPFVYSHYHFCWFVYIVIVVVTVLYLFYSFIHFFYYLMYTLYW